MISFSEYITQPPKILCGVRADKKHRLFEEIHAEPYQFMVHKDDADKYEGKVVGKGIMQVQKFGQKDYWLVHRDVGQEPIRFNDFDAAQIHADHQKIKEKAAIDQHHKALSSHYKPTHTKFDTQLWMYAKGSSNLNQTLMDGERVPEQAFRLDHALNHQGTPDDMVVYSGISSAHAAKITSNDVVHHPAFLSTSLSMNIAAGFTVSQNSNHILKIHVPTGHRGAYMGDISAHPDEKEFLLPRNLKLRIHHDKQTIMKGNGGINMHVHHATIENT